jgi:hypothetical protein
MTKRLHYGATAKALHRTVVVLLIVQYSIGWLMPGVHRGPPGVPMTWHISIGTVIFALIFASEPLPEINIGSGKTKNQATFQPRAEAKIQPLNVVNSTRRLSSQCTAPDVIRWPSWKRAFWRHRMPQAPQKARGPRWMASELHVGLTGDGGAAHHGRVGASVLLSRWRNAADAARPSCGWSVYRRAVVTDEPQLSTSAVKHATADMICRATAQTTTPGKRLPLPPSHRPIKFVVQI